MILLAHLEPGMLFEMKPVVAGRRQQPHRQLALGRPHSRAGSKASRIRQQASNKEGDPEDDSKESREEGLPPQDQLDTFLDTEFFRPDEVADDAAPPLKWFARLVQNDYATAEALYASLFVAGMVLITQELVRMQLYGAQYVPFVRGGGGGGGGGATLI